MILEVAVATGIPPADLWALTGDELAYVYDLIASR